jgi:hypothetical protein
VYNDWVINRDDMDEVGENLVFVIESISYEDRVSNCKEHEISVVDSDTY